MEIGKILIANRGEIALRIQRTCRSLGIPSVAIYSPADVNSPFVQAAEEAYSLGDSSEAAQSYLNIEKIIKICQKAGVDAVHPGYGFLSENANFAQALENHKICFIGPKAESIRLMGDKVSAIAKMRSEGVPVVPGFHAQTMSESELLEQAEKIGYPILIKASAGGGGKGMKRVYQAEDFAAAYASAKREAKNFFADERVFIEKYIENPRHIEIQVFGDTQGNAVHLFERDCSIQRRHQKIVEETPAQIPQELKETMAEAALLATRSIDYQGAGTVEFIVSQENKFYFLEMNTRLQVEHPVTEMVSGVDLVALQIHIASGKSLQDFSLPGQPTGHSMELRIYAEDPQNNFLPDTGTIYQYQEPSGEGIRVDSGVVQGSAVSVYYDPMLAKLIVSSSNREQSLEIAKRALDDFVIQGIKTNQGYLQALLENLDFRKGNFTTHFLEEQQLEQKLSQKYKPLFLAVSHLLCNSFWQHPKPLQSVQLSFQRENFQSHPKTYQFYLQQEHCKFDRFLYNGEEYQILLERFGEESGSRQLQYSIGQKGKDEKESYNLLVQNTFQEGKLFLQDATCVYFYRYGLQIYLFYAGESCQISLLQRETLFQAKDGSAYTSPMPGKILKVFIETGQVVQKGDTLLVVEAMKMENEIKAQSQIQIEEILVQPGDLVALGQTLLTSKEDKEEKRYA